MANQSLKRFLHHLDCRINQLKIQQSYQQFAYSFLTRWQSQQSKADKTQRDDLGMGEAVSQVPIRSKQNEKINYDSGLIKYGSDDDALSETKWRLELAWLSKTLEPALELCRRALPIGNADGQKSPASTRSLMEIITSIQNSKIGIEDWSLSDLTVGLYLIYLRQASANQVEDVKGDNISSDSMVQDLIYHTELAKGSYKENAAGLAQNSMLREKNVLKFVRDSSVMRPGYYIGVDIRNRLVILGIRGTHTVYDLITDVVSSSDKEITFEGYSTHFGTAEAARWFLHHEIATIRKCLEKHEGFRLRLVGHSLGGAAASLLAIMLRKKSSKELGFSPDIVSAVGIATPPCVSKELAESCSSYVSTVVMQDDVIPRLSAASLARLRNEILQTDWMSVLEKEDWKRFIELVTNAKQVVSSVQDVARKVADYAKFRNQTNVSDIPILEPSGVAEVSSTSKLVGDTSAIIMQDRSTMPEELFVPGTVYYLRREADDSISGSSSSSNTSKSRESYKLWKRKCGEHFQRIVLSGNFISDHKCECYYYALRDVLKGLPRSDRNASMDEYKISSM